jgi:hypothetical protein
MPNVFVNVDYFQTKATLDQALEYNNVDEAKSISKNILDSQKEIKKNTKSVGGKLVFENGVNLIVYIPYDEELIQSFVDLYEYHTKDSANVSVGRDLLEANNLLEPINMESKTSCVVCAPGLQEDTRGNQTFYRMAKKSNFDLKAASRIKSALLELDVIVNEERVSFIFFKLVENNNLDTIEKIEQYFSKPLEEIKSNIRDIYNTKEAGAQEQFAPGQSVVNRNRHQKSPHKRLNWVIREEYSPEVDWKATDLNYVDGNITTESQNMSMGGEPGSAISTAVRKAI